MKCTHCSRHISPRAKFCPYCGKPVAPRRNTSRAAATQSRLPLYAALVVAGVAVGALSIYWLQKTEAGTTSANGFDPTLRGEQLARLYPAVYEVASQFICPCGTCEDGLEVCDCGMARGSSEVRMFIYQLLQVHQPAHAVELVEKEYGHRKTGASSLKFEKLPPPNADTPQPKRQNN
jgi:hypothetical protein